MTNEERPKPMKQYELIRRSDGVVMYQMIVGMGQGSPWVPDLITRYDPDYDPANYEWRDMTTDERLPANPIRRWVYVPADEELG